MQKELFSDVFTEGYETLIVETIPLPVITSTSRWCFTCRTVTEHSSAPVIPIGEAVDTPRHEVHCLACGGKDTDLFPGREREDDEPE